MQRNQTHYFVTANSSIGYKNLLETNAIGLNKAYLLTGDLSLCKYKTLSKISDILTKDGVDLECIHSALEPSELDGIILRKQKVGIFNAEIVPDDVKQSFNEIVLIDTSNILSPSLAEEYATITALKNLINQHYQTAYDTFAKAIIVHDEWEAIYIQHMNFKQADILTLDTITSLLSDKTIRPKGSVHHRFFGGATYKGALDYVPELTAPLSKRYFIKGRPGSGKSTMLKKLLAKASELGYDVDVYHCGFDPKSLDMLIIQPLNICIFDSTAPHEYFPDSQRDVVIDMYAELIDADTDETYKKELDDIRSRYKVLVDEGVCYLAKAKQESDKLDNLYAKYISSEDESSFIDAATQKFIDDLND